MELPRSSPARLGAGRSDRARARRGAAPRSRCSIATSARGEQVAADIGGVFCEVDVTSDEKVAAAFAKAREAHGQERILVNCAGVANAAKTVGRDKETKAAKPYPMQQFELAIQINLIGSFRCIANSALGMVDLDPLEDGEQRRDHQHRVGRGRGRADRAGGLFGVQGRRARDGAADRARPDERRRAGQHHPARRVQDADGRDDAAQRAGRAWRAGAVPQAARNRRGICPAGLFLIENVYMNAAAVRLDGGIRMAPR